MRSTGVALLAIFLIFINACGRIYIDPRYSTKSMTEKEALETLQQVPVDEQGRMARGSQARVSVLGLIQLLQSLVQSGQLRLDGMRGAASSGADLGQLMNIFSLLQGGQASSILGLAQGLTTMNGGSATGTSSGLNTLLQLLNMALPIIMVIAPQYAPVVQALITILPLVLTFISLFKKTSAPSASYPILVPTFA